jgi:hypothetical protein
LPRADAGLGDAIGFGARPGQSRGGVALRKRADHRLVDPTPLRHLTPVGPITLGEQQPNARARQRGRRRPGAQRALDIIDQHVRLRESSLLHVSVDEPLGPHRPEADHDPCRSSKPSAHDYAALSHALAKMICLVSTLPLM